MFPTNATKLAYQSNRVFFVNGDINTAFDTAPIDRPVVSVFNPGEESIYLGGSDVSPSKFIEEVLPGKLAVIESLGRDAVYCINESGNTGIAYASEFY